MLNGTVQEDCSKKKKKEQEYDSQRKVPRKVERSDWPSPTEQSVRSHMSRKLGF